MPPKKEVEVHVECDSLLPLCDRLRADADDGNAVTLLEVYTQWAGSSKVIAPSLRAWFTKSDCQSINFRMFKIACETGVETASKVEGGLRPVEREVVDLLNERIGHSKPLFLFFWGGRLVDQVDGIITPVLQQLFDNFVAARKAVEKGEAYSQPWRGEGQGEAHVAAAPTSHAAGTPAPPPPPPPAHEEGSGSGAVAVEEPAPASAAPDEAPAAVEQPPPSAEEDVPAPAEPEQAEAAPPAAEEPEPEQPEAAPPAAEAPEPPAAAPAAEAAPEAAAAAEAEAPAAEGEAAAAE